MHLVFATSTDQQAIFLDGVLIITDCATGFRPTPYVSPREVADRIAVALHAKVIQITIPQGTSARLTALRDWDDITKLLARAHAMGTPPGDLFKGAAGHAR